MRTFLKPFPDNLGLGERKILPPSHRVSTISRAVACVNASTDFIRSNSSEALPGFNFETKYRNLLDLKTAGSIASNEVSVEPQPKLKQTRIPKKTILNDELHVDPHLFDQMATDIDVDSDTTMPSSSDNLNPKVTYVDFARNKVEEAYEHIAKAA